MDKLKVARELILLAKELTGETRDGDPEEYTKAVAKNIQKKKGQLGISGFRQNYKGTGSKKAVRQIWIRFKNGAVLDLWIFPDRVEYGGVVYILPSGEREKPNPSRRKTLDDPREMADVVADDLMEWMAE